MGPADFTLDFYGYFSENKLCRQGKFRIFELKQDKIFFERKFQEKTSLVIQKFNSKLKIKYMKC